MPDSDRAMGGPTPLSLLEKLRANDQFAWERFALLYTPLVYHWCARWQVRGDDADDVVQEVFRAVAAGIADFQRQANGKSYPFRAWLAGIARHKLGDHRRASLAIPVAAGGSEAYRQLQQVAEPPVPDDEADGDALSGVYHRALELVRGEFEEKSWKAFWRTAVDGLPATDAAAELGLSAAAVRQAKSRVLRRLKEEVGDLID